VVLQAGLAQGGRSLLDMGETVAHTLTLRARWFALRCDFRNANHRRRHLVSSSRAYDREKLYEELLIGTQDCPRPPNFFR